MSEETTLTARTPRSPQRGRPKKTKRAGLNDQQRRFVAEYLDCLSGAKAARRAGYSPKTADSIAYTLLRKAEIRDAVQKGTAARLDKAELSAVRVLESNRRIHDVDVRDFFDAQGNAIPVTEWTAEMGAVVASIEVVKKNATAGDGVTDTVLKLKFWNKNQALELSFKHLQLLEPEPVDAGEGVPCFIMPEGTGIKIL